MIGKSQLVVLFLFSFESLAAGRVVKLLARRRTASPGLWLWRDNVVKAGYMTTT